MPAPVVGLARAPGPPVAALPPTTPPFALTGGLPASWRALEPARLLAALQPLDPAYTGWLDWRQLLVCLAGAALPALHEASAADMAAQAAAAAKAGRRAKDPEGCLSAPAWERLRLWFEPNAEWVAAQQEAGGSCAAAAEEALHLAAGVKQLLWRAFSREEEPAAASSRPPSGSSAHGGGLAAVAAAAAAAGATQAAQPAAAGASPSPAAAASASGGGSQPHAPLPPPPPALLNWPALLVYCCADRSHAAGVRKAMAVVSGEAGASARVTAAQVHQLAYPLGPEAGAALQRSPLGLDAIAAAVAAAGGEAGAVRSEQLLYGPACERVVALLLGRYERQDIYTLARV